MQDATTARPASHADCSVGVDVVGMDAHVQQ